METVSYSRAVDTSGLNGWMWLKASMKVSCRCFGGIDRKAQATGAKASIASTGLSKFPPEALHVLKHLLVGEFLAPGADRTQ